MLNENARKWVAALRSGKYKKTTNTLTRVAKDGQIEGCCCLGVACELALESGMNLRQETNWSGRREYDYEASILPHDVKVWLGLKDVGGSYTVAKDDSDHQLSSDNDNGKSFAEIADIIESEPEGLFS